MNEKKSCIEMPNLPTSRVRLAVSARPLRDILCIAPPPVYALPPSLQTHADLQLCHLGGAFLLAAPAVFSYYKEKLSPFGFEILCGKTRLDSPYPLDAAYNIARVGNVAFHNPDITDPVALRFFTENGIRLIPIRQGYAKCSILPVDADSLITADHGIARAAKAAGFSVLEIQPGGVELAGFPYGFLGGAGGKTDRDTLYVTGRLAAHPSYREILSFLQERSIKLEEGSIPIPVDIGSILPLR